MDNLTLDLNSVDHKTVENFLNKGLDIDCCGIYKKLCHSPLMAAVKENNVELVKFILSRGADPNKLIPCHATYAMTALHAAIFTENIDIKIIQYLLDYGVDVNYPAIDREKGHEVYSSPLQYAVHSQDEKIVSLLLSKNADVNFKSKNDGTALHIACSNEISNIVRYLLEYGADVDVVSDDNLTKGQTPLFVAISWNQTEAVKLLLDNDANINITNFNGKSVLKLLNENTDEKINVMVKQHVVKLMAANYYVDTNISQEVVNDNTLIDFHNICINEIDKMKREKIYGTSVVYHHIMIKSIHKLSLFAKNERIKSGLSDPVKLENIFPHYAFILINRFKKGLERRKLLDKAEKFIFDFFMNELPNTFIRQLFFYFSNRDLEILSIV
ncbi:putative ankyrin repeat protein RBE_0220 [Cotesia glomerata]|uniref:Uncharacterized protein n=1 Tax=Cotesia glomerata TaxID=32391 RepID=A0AAV7HWC9_COTGL|nr:putative ankyrin repeat protein RBE_0220 [Cotesia glomerata]XP_044587236.1 putative ankyrin repeat protein RBE_0220 [Cotesia glomerata]KAH0534827.1 hypothetical protein KQX54_009132 [Cotesia glomerata]